MVKVASVPFRERGLGESKKGKGFDNVLFYEKGKDDKREIPARVLFDERGIG